ncbi:MAG: 3-hydroxyacyl-CoA dehydrogenase NAD-binding domain-containing protein [Alphaproteobacteria bacterium]|nr:3-hydroxyacyl-CoA dehydrogenase NAD-binding domain-containing protein [Alphaproteobacteria bacterium]
MSADIKTVAVVGTGVIGAGWAARLLFNGINVTATDPGGAPERLRESVENAWASMSALFPNPPARGELRFERNLVDAVGDADFVQENAPENEDLKRELLAEISRATKPEVPIASSSSGLLPSRIQSDCITPERVLIGHPFNPVYLLPLVETLGGDRTDPAVLDLADAFYTSIGMHALRVRREVEGYISDRLQEAMWREILHMVKDGIATTDEIDRAIAYGPGLRWAGMGTCLTFHLAGGAGGMRHMLEHFGPALEQPWTHLKAPELTPELIERMADGCEAQADGRSVRDLERERDAYLVAVLQALRDVNVGAGQTLPPVN